jgi:hypothetical protein|nr:MAG TPA: hypothetical protein [Caudoviricetes sp.]
MKISKIAMLISEPEVIIADNEDMFQIVTCDRLFRYYCLNDIESISVEHDIYKKIT